MANDDPLDFWYAVHNTQVTLMPTQRLETFGTTILNYHMISELMDTIGQVRVREGRIQAYRPEIIAPSAMASQLLEGFGTEAGKYAEWILEHASELRFLRYGFKIRKQEIQSHVITDSLKTVAERVEKEVRGKDDPLSAVLVGVDEPWEVCLLKLMCDVWVQSAPGNVRDFDRRGQVDAGTAPALRREIESDFRKATEDSTHIKLLGEKLQKMGLFKEYEERFFSLVRTRMKR